jgi:hypothetical protein
VLGRHSPQGHRVTENAEKGFKNKEMGKGMELQLHLSGWGMAIEDARRVGQLTYSYSIFKDAGEGCENAISFF